MAIGDAIYAAGGGPIVGGSGRITSASTSGVTTRITFPSSGRRRREQVTGCMSAYDLFPLSAYCREEPFLLLEKCPHGQAFDAK
jgi:hypothetical protein